MNEIEFVESVQTLEVKRGDLVIIKIPEHITDSTFANLRGRLRNYFPNNKFIIMDGGTDIGIIRGT